MNDEAEEVEAQDVEARVGGGLKFSTIWLVPVVGGSWFLYVPGFILLGTASRRAGRWVNAADRKLPLRVRLWMRPRAVREAFAVSAGKARGSSGKAATAGAGDHRPAPREAAPAGDDRFSEGTPI